MFGNLSNLPGLFKQAKEMQERMQQLQQELQARRHQGEAGAGAVTATVDGRGTLVDIKISPDAVGDLELLEEMIKGAVAAATQKSQQAAQSELANLTGGLNIPGLTDLLGGGRS